MNQMGYVMEPISPQRTSVATFRLVTPMPRPHSPIILENDEVKQNLASLIVRTSNLYTQLSMFSAGGVYNRSLKRSINAVALGVGESIPTDRDGRIQPLDENRLAYKSERTVLLALANLIIEEQSKIRKSRLFTGYFRISRANETLISVSVKLKKYADSIQ